MIGMYVNLHTLPPGQHMYTLYLGWENLPYGAEEVDVVAPATATVAQVLENAGEQLLDYLPGWRLLAVADQSAGTLLYKEDEL